MMGMMPNLDRMGQQKMVRIVDDFADQTQVDRGCCFRRQRNSPPSTPSADCVQPGGQESPHDGLRWWARQHHLGHGQRLGISDAQTVDLDRFDAQPGLQRGDLRPPPWTTTSGWPVVAANRDLPRQFFQEPGVFISPPIFTMRIAGLARTCGLR